MRWFLRVPAILLLLLCIAVLIHGCSHVPVAVCPAVIPYTLSAQTQAAAELDALPADAILRTFMRDYGIERAKLRSCQ